MKQKIQLLLILLLLTSGALQAQMKTITGEVFDENNEPLPLVEVIIKNTNSSKTTKGVSTDIDGKFELKAKGGVPTYRFYIWTIDGEKQYADEPAALNATDYLPSLEGYGWSTGEKNFTKTQQLDFKRARMDVIIVKKGSDPKAKYELFQRLNTGGANLEPQEVRNCLIIMVNKSIFELICECESDENFSECVPVSDRKELEQYKKEVEIL